MSFSDSILAISRNGRLPLSPRRHLARSFIPFDGSDFTIDCDGVPFEGRLDNYVEWVVYVTGQFYEYTYINLIEQIVTGGVALDVGANIGNHSLAFSRFFDQVYSVEPYPMAFERLDRKTHVVSNIHPFQLGLSDVSGKRRFQSPKRINLGLGSVSDSGDIEIEVMVGDEFVRDNISDPVNFIKIDVEGHEFSVLSGLRNTIANDRPIVMFEFFDGYLDQPKEELEAMLEVFPEDYLFVSLGGQTSFPIQHDVATVKPVYRGEGKTKITYIIAYGPERNLECVKKQLRPAA